MRRRLIIAPVVLGLSGFNHCCAAGDHLFALETRALNPTQSGRAPRASIWNRAPVPRPAGAPPAAR